MPIVTHAHTSLEHSAAGPDPVAVFAAIGIPADPIPAAELAAAAAAFPTAPIGPNAAARLAQWRANRQPSETTPTVEQPREPSTVLADSIAGAVASAHEQHPATSPGDMPPVIVEYLTKAADAAGDTGDTATAAGVGNLLVDLEAAETSGRFGEPGTVAFADRVHEFVRDVITDLRTAASAIATPRQPAISVPACDCGCGTSTGGWCAHDAGDTANDRRGDR